MKKLFTLLLVSIFCFFGAGLTNTIAGGSTWYFSIQNSADLVEGDWFTLDIRFMNADNGDPNVLNDGHHDLNVYFLDLQYDTSIMEYADWVEYTDHYSEDPPGPTPPYIRFDGGKIPSQPTEDPYGYLYDIMGSADLDHQRAYFPDDSPDPRSTPVPNTPNNYLGRIWFLAKVTGHFDDLNVLFASPNTDCLARVDYVVYDNPADFTTWKTDDGFSCCSWQRAHTLRIGVDTLGNDSFPQVTTTQPYFTGVASCMQTLNWMYGEPYDLYTGTQEGLYDTYHSGDFGADMNTADVRALLQSEKPVTSPSYAYNFGMEQDDDEDMAIKRFIHWCDFNVQAYYPSATGVNEPNIPPAVVTNDSTYGYQWKTVRGFATDVDPCDESSVFTIPDMEVYGLWLNDPLAAGLGYNMYVTGDEFKDMYEQVDGKYRSVCEPPEGIDIERVEVNLERAKIKFHKPGKRMELAQLIKDEKLLSKNITSLRSLFLNKIKQGKELIPFLGTKNRRPLSKGQWDDVIPDQLKTSPDFSGIYEDVRYGKSLSVFDLDSDEEYSLVLFSQKLRADDISMALILSDDDAVFRQATWSEQGQSFLTGREARRIARAHILWPRNIRLVWTKANGLSRFQPMYEVSNADETVYVLQDGTCLTEMP